MMPRWLTAAVAAAVFAGAVVLWRAGDGDAAARIEAIDVEMASWANGERKWNGLSPLLIGGDLSAQAAQQSERMAACRCLYHSPSGELGWWLSRGWTRIGENVGATSGQG